MRCFECKRGGHCCSRGLLGWTAAGHQLGLYLTPEEAVHFPADSMAPLLRAGNRVFAYQLTVDRCPNLAFEDGLAVCQIYENRPLTCRAFPAVAGVDGSVEVRLGECPCTAAFPGEAWDIASFGDCVAAVREQIHQANTNPQATAMYVLEKQAWVAL